MIVFLTWVQLHMRPVKKLNTIEIDIWNFISIFNQLIYLV